jgi:hypothetical protein
VLAVVFLEAEQTRVAQRRFGVGLEGGCAVQRATEGNVEQPILDGEPIAVDLKIWKLETRPRKLLREKALVHLPEALLLGILEL